MARVFNWFATTLVAAQYALLVIGLTCQQCVYDSLTGTVTYDGKYCNTTVQCNSLADVTEVEAQGKFATKRYAAAIGVPLTEEDYVRFTDQSYLTAAAGATEFSCYRITEQVAGAVVIYNGCTTGLLQNHTAEQCSSATDLEGGIQTLDCMFCNDTRAADAPPCNAAQFPDPDAFTGAPLFCHVCLVAKSPNCGRGQPLPCNTLKDYFKAHSLLDKASESVGLRARLQQQPSVQGPFTCFADITKDKSGAITKTSNRGCFPMLAAEELMQDCPPEAQCRLCRDTKKACNGVETDPGAPSGRSRAAGVNSLDVAVVFLIGFGVWWKLLRLIKTLDNRLD